MEISVRDTGIGIAPELLPHVFELFTQAERSPDRSQGGLGLGLALVRSLAELHGGSVEAHSEGIDRGSLFTVRLPRLMMGDKPGAPRAEPAPRTIRPAEADKGYVAPRRLIEALLADIWAEVLAVELIGVYDNLFDLGGDSIRCVQIATRVQQVGLAITPKQLLRYQTIDRLVNHLLARQQSAEQVEQIEHFLRAAEQS